MASMGLPAGSQGRKQGHQPCDARTFARGPLWRRISTGFGLYDVDVRSGGGVGWRCISYPQPAGRSINQSSPGSDLMTMISMSCPRVLPVRRRGIHQKEPRFASFDFDSPSKGVNCYGRAVDGYDS